MSRGKIGKHLQLLNSLSNGRFRIHLPLENKLQPYPRLLFVAPKPEDHQNTQLDHPWASSESNAFISESISQGEESPQQVTPMREET